jgi:hypothetical protein
MRSHGDLFESLESRRLLATFMVSNATDDGAGSLRVAIAQANALPGADVIEFDERMAGNTIFLKGEQLSITDDLSINGPEKFPITISPDNALTDFPVLRLLVNEAGVSTTITGLVLRGGNAEGPGGAISNAGTLALVRTTVSGSRATLGGGIYNSGTLTVTNSTISRNRADDRGGGIFSVGTLTLMNSTVAENLAVSDGGGIAIESGSVTAISTIVAGNTGAGLPNEVLGAFAGGSTHNLIQDAGTAGGLSDAIDGNIVGVDPQLGPLSLHGGPTHTHALLPDSPAVGAGTNPLSLTTDQRGGTFARVTDGGVDIGAFQHEAFTATYVVDTLVDENDGDYSQGDLSLREAIELGNDLAGPAAISFAPDLHGGTIILGGTDLEIDDDVTITGPGSDLLTISGNHASRVFSNHGGVTLLISGLTITGGNGTGVGAHDGGGGIANFGILILIDSRVMANRAADDGGGIGSSGVLMLVNSIVSGNEALDLGGGISYGGFGSLTIRDSFVWGNTARAGGGICVSSNATLIDSTVSGNHATEYGGGMLTSSGTISLLRSTVSGNTAQSHGGGIEHHLFGRLIMSSSAITGNSASGNGGGISNSSGGILVLSNSTVSGNSAARGGGIYNDSTDAWEDAIRLIIKGSTVADNTATAAGGGVYMDPWFYSVRFAESHSSIFAGNTVNGLASDFVGRFEAGSSHNLIGHTAGANGLINGVDGNVIGVDSLLGPLADNGGPTWTHALLAGSPAIDAGSNPSSLAIDQRGFERTIGEGTDIGAFEYNEAPMLSSLITSSRSVVIGQSVTIDAGSASDSDGLVARVRFYLDRNANGIAEEDELVGTDENGQDGFAVTVPIGAALGAGEWTFLAVAEDGQGLASAAAACAITVAEATSIGSPAGAANSIDVQRVVSVDTLGHVLVYREGWTFENITEKAGAPVAISNAVIWTDPKDGLTYAASPSAAGLILFTRGANGTWSFRNLSEETGATDSPAGNLTQFVSKRQKVVVIAGITESGRVVAFREALQSQSPGVRAYAFVDVSGDLEAQGQTTPELTGLTSYVPRWDTWHLAGIDTAGRIQSIWINPNNPAFTRWRTNDLSAITGAPALSGQLAVTLTAWGGINLTGLDASGEMLTTWWVPRFGGAWAVSNLTERYGGPRLVGGNLTAYTTPWGGVNYVGIDGDGEVRVYWWVPSFGGAWAISRLLPPGTPAASVPTGRLTSYASRAGTLNVFGTNEAGDDLRLTWRPGAGSIWSVENLSEIAVEA